MPSYYVFVPDHPEFLTAEVKAPDARHSRTAYLDFLTRNGYINYSLRSVARKVIKVAKMEPGSIQTAVQLEYGMAEPPVQELVAPPSEPQYQDATVYKPTPDYSSPGTSHQESIITRSEPVQVQSTVQAPPVQPQTQPVQAQQKNPFGNSRLARIVRGSGGL
jgi:hypothetical protein